VWIYPYDVNNVDGIRDLYAHIIAETNGVDVLVNNAGGTKRVQAEATTANDWDFVIHMNLTSVFTFCQVFGRERIKSGRSGKIINTGMVSSPHSRQ
jgi:NAD(P)-dependent dehydrogenase (short-subunit alcohol dehydrogenase family)